MTVLRASTPRIPGRRPGALAALALALTLGGCADARRADLLPPPGFQPPPAQAPRKIPLRAHRIFYQDGFFPPEQDGHGYQLALDGPAGCGAAAPRQLGT